MVYEICNQPLLFLDSGISTSISTEDVSTSLKCHSTQGEWREQLSGNHLSNNEFHHQVAKKLQEFLLSWFVSLSSWLNWTLCGSRNKKLTVREGIKDISACLSQSEIFCNESVLFQATLDRAWSSLGLWKMSLLMAGGGTGWGLGPLPTQTILRLF